MEAKDSHACSPGSRGHERSQGPGFEGSHRKGHAQQASCKSVSHASPPLLSIRVGLGAQHELRDHVGLCRGRPASSVRGPVLSTPGPPMAPHLRGPVATLCAPASALTWAWRKGTGRSLVSWAVPHRPSAPSRCRPHDCWLPLGITPTHAGTCLHTPTSTRSCTRPHTHTCPHMLDTPPHECMPHSHVHTPHMCTSPHTCTCMYVAHAGRSWNKDFRAGGALSPRAGRTSRRRRHYWPGLPGAAERSPPGSQALLRGPATPLPYCGTRRLLARALCGGTDARPRRGSLRG